jgi:hypothetical protein
LTYTSNAVLLWKTVDSESPLNVWTPDIYGSSSALEWVIRNCHASEPELQARVAHQLPPNQGYSWLIMT